LLAEFATSWSNELPGTVADCEVMSVKTCCDRKVVTAETWPPPSGTTDAALSRALHAGCIRMEKFASSLVNGANTERALNIEAVRGPVARFVGYQTASPFTL